MELVATSLPEMMDDAVARYGELPCTNFLGKTLTYAQIGELSDRVAKGLQDIGVGAGTSVGLLLPNSPTFVVFFFGALKAGATVVNFNPLYTVEELEHQARDADCSLMITLDLKVLFDKVEALLASDTLQRAVVGSFSDLLPSSKSILFRLFKTGDLAKPQASPQADKVISQDELTDNDGAYARVDIDPVKALAVLQYTGGTTGIPKGAMLSHANLTINVQQVLAWAPELQDGGERVLGILPFFHVFAMTTVMNVGIAKGAEMVLMPKFELDEALALIESTKPTMLPGVPTLYNAILGHRRVDRIDLSSLDFCISGGAALPIEVKSGFEAATGCRLVEGYGLSETSPVATCNPLDGPVKEGSIGIPIPRTHLSIRSLDDPAQELPIGEDGEICIKGPQVMSGYWNKPEETEKAFVGDYLRTGDVGHFDEDGFVFIVDRIKDVINCSGFKVYPRQVEEAIYQHPSVDEVTVIGIPDTHRGEAPMAFVKLREGQPLTDEDLLDFLKPKISKIEMPVKIAFREQLPKTMIGKLSKKELRDEAFKLLSEDG